jgi:flagellar protein FliO/FliZ
MKRFHRSACAFATLAVAHPALAAAEAATPVVGAGSILQVLLGLVVVLGMVFAAAWAVRRFNPNAVQGGGVVRVVGGTSVGNRERVLVVEVADTWLVVGVAPGRVSQLHSLPRPPQAATAVTPAMPGAGFAAWLRQTIDSRNAKGPGR